MGIQVGGGAHGVEGGVKGGVLAVACQNKPREELASLAFRITVCSLVLDCCLLR